MNNTVDKYLVVCEIRAKNEKKNEPGYFSKEQFDGGIIIYVSMPIFQHFTEINLGLISSLFKLTVKVTNAL